MTGSAAPDLHLEFSDSESFATSTRTRAYVLSAPTYTYETMYRVATFPDGLWVRWAGRPSIKAHATNKGYCAGWTPRP